MVSSGDWHSYADEFTEDAVHRGAGMSDIVGRESIREWVVRMMTTYPGNQIERLEVVWCAADADAQAVVYELRSVMSDPGDGSQLTASTTASIGYAGDGLWSWVVEAHSLAAFRRMWESWSDAAVRSGHLSGPPQLSPGPDPVDRVAGALSLRSDDARHVDAAPDDGVDAAAALRFVEPHPLGGAELGEHPQRPGVAVVGRREQLHHPVVRRDDDVAQEDPQQAGAETPVDVRRLADHVVEADRVGAPAHSAYSGWSEIR